MLLLSSTNVGLAALTKCPDDAVAVPPESLRHVTYGVLPENVMSGRVESLLPVEIGCPLLTGTNRAAVPVPTRRLTNT